MFLIRPVESADFESVAALTNHFILHTAVHFASDAVTADELRGSWVKSRTRYPFMVAETDGVFAGYAKAGVWRERSAYQWTPETGIYVEPRMHARGIGTALYAALLEAMRSRGFRSAVAGITLPNEASVRLHEKVGFRSVGVVRDAGFKFGSWHDVGFWQIMLGGGGVPPPALA